MNSSWVTYLKSGAWGVSENLAYPLLMLIATPIYLSLLGEVQYGQWMLVATFVSMGGLSGGGMGASATKDVSAHRGKNDLTSAKASVQAALFVSISISCLMSFLMILLLYIDLSSLFALIGDSAQITAIVTFSVILIILEQIDTVFVGTIKGMERYDVAAKIEIIFKTLIVVSTIITAYLYSDIQKVLLVLTILIFFRLIVKAIAAARLLGVKILLPKWDGNFVKKSFDFGRWSWFQSIGGIIFSVGDRLIIGSILGPEALTRYSIALQLAQQIHTIPSAAMNFIFPLISRKIKKNGNNHDSIKRLSYNLIKINIIISLLISMPIIIFSYEILSLWVGTEIANTTSFVMSVLAVGYLILSLNVAPHFVLLGLNVARFVSLSNIVGGVITLILSIFFTPVYGLIGAAISRTMYGVVVSSNLIILKNKLNKGV